VSTCPNCKKTLELITHEEKELLQCTQCKGFWFTNGQFREIKQTGFSELCSEPAPQASPDVSDNEGVELACPDCSHETLLAYNYAYSSDIQLHRCPHCKGIWAEQAALLDIEQLLVNYQESLEEAKSKALPLMMEVKRQFKEKEEAWEAERQRQKKQGFFGKFFRKKTQKTQDPVDIFADIHPDNNQENEE